MALKAGNTDFANSMAEAMQNAFNDEVAIRKPRADEQMKFLFIAVAEGVIRHLAAHPEAFNLIVTSSMGDDVSINARVDSISSTGT